MFSCKIKMNKNLKWIEMINVNKIKYKKIIRISSLKIGWKYKNIDNFNFAFFTLWSVKFCFLALLKKYLNNNKSVEFVL